MTEEASKFYVSIFKDSRIGSITRYDDERAKAAGPTEAISLVVNCETQAEVDHFWDKLSAGGQEVQCGWLKDKFGVSWQVVPTVLIAMLQDTNREKSKRAMSAMLKMKKIDIATLQKAFEGR